MVGDQAERSASGSTRTDEQGPDATVTADAQLPALDDREVAALRAVGRRWSSRPRDRAALPIDPGLRFLDGEEPRQGRFVQIRSAIPDTRDDLEATTAGDELDSGPERAGNAIRRLLIGPPLRSTALAEERMGKRLALPVLSPDALSSVAYGPEAMLAILVLAGSSALSLSLPIGAVLVVLMVSVGLGYRQVIRAYPHGGGSYIVASDSLGSNWGLLAGAGLIVDYILTVAVSVASGVAAITSALPSLSPATVPIGLAVIAILVVGNLRGARAAGALFAAPTYMFVIAIARSLSSVWSSPAVTGSTRCPRDEVGDGGARVAADPAGVRLRGDGDDRDRGDLQRCSRVQAAGGGERPQDAGGDDRPARRMFVGVVVIAHLDGASPGSQTVLSQIAHDSVGSGPLYAFVQLSTTLVLLIAANSAINGFPRLLYFMARDGYVPRMFLHMGDRLAFTAGIVVLAVPAALLYAAFGGQTEPLIPLFAIGVFVAFTLAQSAMVVYWRAHREQRWRRALGINLVGAVLSGLVALIAAFTKFTAGAWIVVILIPAIVFGAGGSTVTTGEPIRR